MSTLFDLTGKVAIITGSTKGIGKSIAEEYAKAGAKVVISSRKAHACQQVADELRSQGFDALPVACHVGDKAQLQNLVDRTLEAFGRIDVLVCNAATNPVYGPTHTVSDEAFDKIMGTNVKGTFWLCNMVIPHMVEQGVPSSCCRASPGCVPAPISASTACPRRRKPAWPATCRWSGARRVSASTASPPA